jgi:hypothetical protein
MAAGRQPAEEQAVIDRVHAASVRKDLVALRAEMSEEFIWSFGGDADTEQAISEWLGGAWESVLQA